jgi:hypothetical protein
MGSVTEDITLDKHEDVLSDPAPAADGFVTAIVSQDYMTLYDLCGPNSFGTNFSNFCLGKYGSSLTFFHPGRFMKLRPNNRMDMLY